MTIDLEGIEKNIEAFNEIALMPMVIKGGGHGTDPLELARFFEQRNVPFLGVSHVSEAIALREGGIQAPIFVLAFLPQEAQTLVDYKLTPAVDTPEKVEAIRRAAKGPYPVHLNIDTGLHRFGVLVEEAPLLLKQIEQKLELEGVMTHFVSSEDALMDEFSRKQIELFYPFANKARWTHAASSYAQMRFSLPFCNLARIGLFCLLPHPAISLTATVMGIKQVKQGESIGYGRHFRAIRDMTIAIISIGYHDGWHISYSEKGSVFIRGKSARMIGKICMDFQMVDISDIEGVKVGDPVELIGPNLPLERVAKSFEINPRQLLASLGSRIQRKFIYAQQSLQRAL